jgi:hypothetical protein
VREAERREADAIGPPASDTRAPGAYAPAFARSISFRRSAAYSFEISRFNRSGGTDVGSARYASRSAKAIFFASTSRWRYAAELWTSDATSKPSRMFSISSAAKPWVFGGSSYTSCPR